MATVAMKRSTVIAAAEDTQVYIESLRGKEWHEVYVRERRARPVFGNLYRVKPSHEAQAIADAEVPPTKYRAWREHVRRLYEMAKVGDGTMQLDHEDLAALRIGSFDEDTPL